MNIRSATLAASLLLPVSVWAKTPTPPQVVASVAYDDQTAPIDVTTIYTAAKAGLFRVSVYLETSDPNAGISDFVVGGFGWQDDYKIHVLTLSPIHWDLQFALGGAPTASEFGGPYGDPRPVTIRMVAGSSLTFGTSSGNTDVPLAIPYNLYIVVEALWSGRQK
jgi:hypothetical protein